MRVFLTCSFMTEIYETSSIELSSRYVFFGASNNGEIRCDVTLRKSAPAFINAIDATQRKDQRYVCESNGKAFP